LNAEVFLFYFCSMNQDQLIQLHSVFLASSGVSTDSRKISKDCLFFALKGEHHDGNQFARSALQQGALLAIADDPALCNTPGVFIVDDVLTSLQQLATFHRMQCPARVIGITGSNGKTTTKELITRVLAKKFNVVSTSGNLNNHIGVPLTLLRIKQETEIAVVEMGANHVGEIDFLSRIARPDFGLITNIGKAHLEGFGGIEGVIQAKTELYRFIKETGGMVFLNMDDALLAKHAQGIKQYSYSKTAHSGIRGTLVKANPFVHFQWQIPDSAVTFTIQTSLIGIYNLDNLLAAVAVGHFFEVEPELINAAVESYQPSNNRSQLITKDGFNIIMDAYNANPVSMSAAICNLASLGCSRPVVVLGDMLELGEDSQHEHKAILDLLITMGITEVYLVGTEFAVAAGSYGFPVFRDVHELNNALREFSWTGTHVLIKGSRGIRLEMLDFINEK